MNVAVVMKDLLLYSKIEAQAAKAHARVTRMDGVHELNAGGPYELILVDWNERREDWSEVLTSPAARPARIVLFGRHTDVAAHRAAREAALGPMWARSRLLAQLPTLLPARQ